MFQLNENSVIIESDDSRDSSAYLLQLEQKRLLQKKLSAVLSSQQSGREFKLNNAKLNYLKEEESIEDFNPKIVFEIKKRFKVNTLQKRIRLKEDHKEYLRKRSIPKLNRVENS